MWRAYLGILPANFGCGERQVPLVKVRSWNIERCPALQLWGGFELIIINTQLEAASQTCCRQNSMLSEAQI